MWIPGQQEEIPRHVAENLSTKKLDSLLRGNDKKLRNSPTVIPPLDRAIHGFRFELHTIFPSYRDSTVYS